MYNWGVEWFANPRLHFLLHLPPPGPSTVPLLVLVVPITLAFLLIVIRESQDQLLIVERAFPR